MADFGLAKESVKGLGPGAYLVNVLPSAVLVLGVLTLFGSHLYPWADPLKDGQGRTISPGPSSVMAALHGLGVAGGIVLALGVLITTVFLRPFQISAVQLLEGYWRRRPLLAGVKVLAVERHVRRRSWHRLRVLAGDPTETVLPVAHFDVVAQRARSAQRARLRALDSERIVEQYPAAVESFMPTLLGNVLRRAESNAGERYGMTTVLCYPRLYPFLSAKLSQETETQFNVIDTSCTLAIVNGALAAMAMPLLVRVDGWSLVPLALSVAAGVAYRGARIAAARHGDTLAAAFNLHRFDLLRALRQPLPTNAGEELAINAAVSQVFGGDRPFDIGGAAWLYVHPSGSGDDPALSRAAQPAAGEPDGRAKDSDESSSDTDSDSGDPDHPVRQNEPDSGSNSAGV